MDCFFEKDDLLNRKKHAEFLKTMITHCDRFRREDSSKSFVIAINSEWGTGKTRFVKMLRNYLEERTVDDIAKRKNKTESRFRVVYYNSWEYDFWDDALEPLIYTILNSPEFKPYRFDEKGKKLIKELREYSIGIIKATAYALAHYVIGDAATEEVRTTIKEVIENNQDPLCDFKVRVDLYVNFTKKLQELVSYSKKKLVIIIDELDRCKPTFAIKTLEIAKHLFNVDGLTFIFSLDINQLSSSVRTVYGSDIDSSGYLCRFFDYIGKLPAADLTNFLEKQLAKQNFYKPRDKKGLTPNDRLINIVNYIKTLYSISSLSLRDLTTILNTYHIMTATFLGKYVNLKAHELYLFLLVVKYKDIRLFSKIFSNTQLSEDIISQLDKEFAMNQIPEIRACITRILRKETIGKCVFDVLDGAGNIIFRKMEVSYVELEQKKQLGLFLKYRSRIEDINTTQSTFLPLDFNWGGLLFYDDLIRWEEIKDYTLAQYLYQQLEMFEFAILSDIGKEEII